MEFGRTLSCKQTDIYRSIYCGKLKKWWIFQQTQKNPKINAVAKASKLPCTFLNHPFPSPRWTVGLIPKEPKPCLLLKVLIRPWGRSKWLTCKTMAYRKRALDGLFHGKSHSNGWSLGVPPNFRKHPYPRCSRYGIFTYIWAMFGVKWRQIFHTWSI